MYESNKDGRREIGDRDGNLQTKRGLEITERERGGNQKQVAKLYEKGIPIHAHTYLEV